MTRFGPPSDARPGVDRGICHCILQVPFYNTCIILVVRSIEMEELTAIDYQDRNNVKAKLVHMAHCQPIGSGVLSEERQKLQDASHGGHTNSHDAWV